MKINIFKRSKMVFTPVTIKPLNQLNLGRKKKYIGDISLHPLVQTLFPPMSRSRTVQLQVKCNKQFIVKMHRKTCSTSAKLQLKSCTCLHARFIEFGTYFPNLCITALRYRPTKIARVILYLLRIIEVKLKILKLQWH